MGAKASKPAQSAARKFPTRTPGSAVPPPSSRPSVPPASARRSAPRVSSAKDDAIQADGADPDDYSSATNPAFSQRLRQMGIATPNPTLSNSSTAPGSAPVEQQHFPPPTQNATLNALEARRRLQERAQAEFENVGRGKEFLDVGTLRQILVLRERGAAPAEIERRLRLKTGVVERLGPEGVTSPLSSN
ncbi:hypothetical protein F5B20DRAFT_37885 [Whalleya microplaca]|nr:hypothetical protein F5B20DRAFT_37885 [Whalleya microplaca]